ncbi:MAG: electron transport complex subunit RsxC [Ruminococcaceae bacterium]|nr:electron transport complex subunit RsxC [Oscillospiraceae bacterium]
MAKTIVDGVLKAVKKVRGGVKVDHHKNTAEKAVERLPIPSKVVIPMQQHIGAPCEPVVKVGDTVAVGQLIGDTDKYVSAPIHASVSGTVTAIGDIKLPNGAMSKAITIESDGEMRLWEGIKPPVVNTREDLIKAVRDSGLVGLGGAGFPTHVKLNFPADKNIDTLVINAAECEPFITVDYRECIENSKNILAGVYLLKNMLGFKQVIICIEDNKPDAFKILKDIADHEQDVHDEVKLMVLESKYPQGAEKMMVQSATGRKVPPGKLPADVGCVVMNVASVAFIARYVRTGKPLISRSITVDGSAIAEPKNIRVPVGTNIGEIIDFCGGFSKEPCKILTGGPMMGLAIVGTDLPILKQNNAILAFAKGDAVLKEETDCIRCGKCVIACPMSLMPTNIVKAAKTKDVDMLKKVGVTVCMECGSCAFACPAGKPLVQHMRLAKSILREEGNK